MITPITPSRTTRRIAAVTLVVFAWSGIAGAQAPGAATAPATNAPPGQATSTANPDAKTFSQEQLDQLMAPIALYGTRTNLVQVQGDRLIQRVNLYLAVGGAFVPDTLASTSGSHAQTIEVVGAN